MAAAPVQPSVNVSAKLNGLSDAVNDVPVNDDVNAAVCRYVPASASIQTLNR